MANNKTHVPVRTCIACGAKKNKKEMVRLVLDADGFLIRDDVGKIGGRGAYVCPAHGCWQRLKKGNRLSRAFRSATPVAVPADLENTFEKTQQRPFQMSGRDCP